MDANKTVTVEFEKLKGDATITSFKLLDQKWEGTDDTKIEVIPYRALTDNLKKEDITDVKAKGTTD